VGKKKPNAWGLYDMLGNVWEWVQDWHGSYSSSLAVDPAGPSTGTSKIFRGASWDNSSRFTRVSFRYNSSPGGTNYGIGFRCVRE
jgi:formylglycine-generating enzyme required for sulfatase activity